MTVRRSSLAATAVVAAAVGLLASGSPTRADDAGIIGGVESVIELALEPTSPGAVAATVTSTERRTRLSLSQGASRQRLGEFAGPVTGRREVAHVDRSRRDADITVTFGPQGP